MYMSRHFFVSKINFLFELPDKMSLLGSYLLPIQPPEKIVLIFKKNYGEIN